MQKLFIFFAFLLAVANASAQTPFTITAGNFPKFSTQNYSGPITPAGPNFPLNANGVWDYSAYHGNSITVSDYIPETDPVYTSQGIDVYVLGFKSLTPTLGYDVFQEFDFNSTGVYENAYYVPAQGFGLGAFTSNTADSIVFPLQDQFFQGGRKVMQFPATYQTAWHSESHRSVNFFLTINAAGLHKVPSEQRFTYYRTDSIAAWGSMRIYANGTPSVSYPVLVDRSTQYSIDSFFVGGAPAPAQLLAAFGIAQGQQFGLNKRYTVYREGNSTALAIIMYETNDFTAPTKLYFDTDNLATTGVETPAAISYSTLLFPNPVASGVLNLQVMGDLPELSNYTIVDQNGRSVQTGAVALQGGAMQILLNQALPSGNYILQGMDTQGKTLINEQFFYSR